MSDAAVDALGVLRRGLAASPVLRAGVRASVGLALFSAAGKLVVPIALRQIIDRGFVGGFRATFVYSTTAIAALAIVAVTLLNRVVYLRMVRYAQDFLYDLRVRTFAHIHRLAIAHHNEAKRGVLVTRVTSDIVTLSQFAQWGAMSWIINSVTVVVVVGVLALYAWQLAVVTVVVFAPVLPAMRYLQRRQLAAYDWQRSAVASTLSEVSESVMGAAVIRAYGTQRSTRRRLHAAIDDQYRANMRAAAYFSVMFALSDLVGAVAVGTVIGVGVWWGPDWGLSSGTVVAALFLTNLLLTPIGEIGEVLDQTQAALAGWRKILDLLDEPVEVADPSSPRPLPSGPLGVEVEGVSFAYGDGPAVLADVSLSIPPGANVAVVGETGSGKTTLVKLLCRLADPTHGRVLVGGVDLREVSAKDRAGCIRLVPQDGFLFDTTLAENLRLGRADATDAEIEEALRSLGLGWWLDRLADGLATSVGERGENLSVGERQLVSLARAQLSDAGLLLLDEATSAVDPETERALSEALLRLAAGRTTVSVAHRLSTAEVADQVIVFDHGRVVEVGTHQDLVAAGGVYAGLYDSWLGNTRS
ncbi:MAG: ABC transporter ATP-binding protein [Microthrixaceae bacterium]|nr:ABC transporter ATP-binding protein [Microthrixaceae bacterium]